MRLTHYQLRLKNQLLKKKIVYNFRSNDLFHNGEGAPLTPIFHQLIVSKNKIGSNLLSAISIGTSEGIRMAVNVAAMLLVFIALIAMLSSILGGVGDITVINSWIESNTIYKSLSIEFILGYLFAPLMWNIGVAKDDIALMGQLLGIKLVASEFVGYTQLVDLKNGLLPNERMLKEVILTLQSNQQTYQELRLEKPSQQIEGVENINRGKP